MDRPHAERVFALVAEIAAGGETMSAKSTYFHPKLLSSLVLDPLRGS